MKVNAKGSQSLESTLHGWMSECRSEEHIQLWLMALWTIYLVVTGTVAPALWTGLAIGVPAAMALAWTATEWKRTVRQRRQMQFEETFIQSMTDPGSMADVMDDRSSFWRNSLFASTLATSGLSRNLDVHVRASLNTDLAEMLTHILHRVAAPQDRIGILLDSLAAAGLLFTFHTATHTGSLAVALSAAFWLCGLMFLGVQTRKRRVRRNEWLTRIVDEGARWMSMWIQAVIPGTPDSPKPFRRTEYYRRLPWVRPA